MLVTNYAPGMRGINLKDEGTRWLNPGDSLEFDEADMIGAMPDLGQATEATIADQAALTQELASANAQIASLQATIADQAAQIEALTSPQSAKK